MESQCRSVKSESLMVGCVSAQFSGWGVVTGLSSQATVRRGRDEQGAGIMEHV